MKPFRPVGHQAVTAGMATLRLSVDFPLREIEPMGHRSCGACGCTQSCGQRGSYCALAVGPSSHPAQCSAAASTLATSRDTAQGSDHFTRSVISRSNQGREPVPPCRCSPPHCRTIAPHALEETSAGALNLIGQKSEPRPRSARAAHSRDPKLSRCNPCR
jgi:hypothetical protein